MASAAVGAVPRRRFAISPLPPRRQLVALLCVAASWASVLAGSHYDTLGVARGASQAEIRRAYRALALRWHPDKNPGNREEAERRFVDVAAAYEVLSDERARSAYDRGGQDLAARGGRGGRGGAPFDFARASEMFADNFGEALARDWRPGMRISGTLVRNGRRVTITINPDGTSDEKEEHGAQGSYSVVSRRDEYGGTSVVITGSLGDFLAENLLPEPVRSLPLLGPALILVASWLPTLSCMSCLWCCCCRRGGPADAEKGD
eukprot:TRINITY_DN64833_c0_g1_i1.p1 TRINITY_DN64833_c0_g1~~TRINITY_DN64833_c0_g1_i1.p1  ORF type:complete len:292 (+),score=59.46 TRINITY_DN64833_c0_g1_i1:93-878(+)